MPLTGTHVIEQFTPRGVGPGYPEQTSKTSHLPTIVTAYQAQIMSPGHSHLTLLIMVTDFPLWPWDTYILFIVTTSVNASDFN